jgi:hypothetical protein
MTCIALLVNIAVIAESGVIDLGMLDSIKGFKEHMANMVTDYLAGKMKKEETKKKTE